MISLIACINKANYIGKDNELLYKNKEDMEHFAKVTKKHHYCLMGKNTFDSLLKPLEGRENIVLVDNPNDKSLKKYPNVQYVDEHCMYNYLLFKASRDEFDVIVIGGEHLYNKVLSYPKITVRDLYLTVVDDREKGDATFPFIDSEEYRLISREEICSSFKKEGEKKSYCKAEIRVYRKLLITK